MSASQNGLLPSKTTAAPSTISQSSGILYSQTNSTGIVSEIDNENNIYSAGTKLCFASEDAFESDNKVGNSHSIGLGQTQVHNFSHPEDEDWVKFGAAAGKTYTVQTKELGISADTYLYLYDTDGTTLLASNDDFGNSLSSRIEWTATKNGTYYMQARHWNPNSGGCDTQYNLLISEGSVSNANGADTTGVFRPSNGLLYLKNLNITGFADVAINYGLGGDYPVVGDWDGDGTATIGIYRGGSFYLSNSNTVGFADWVFPFGQAGDQPIAGDWDGDGIDTIGIFRPSTG